MASSSKFGNVYPRPAPAGSQQPQPHAFSRQNQNPRFKGKKAKYNPNVTCTYYRKNGHVELNCFRLIGFSDDFQFTHDNGFNNQEQYNQFVKMFKHMKMEEGTNSGMKINANAVAGTIVKYLGSCFSVTNSSTWIIDSGASEHMCFDSTSFRSLSSLTPPLTINLPNCQTILVTHIGTDLSMRRPQVFGEVSEGLYMFKPKVKKSVFNSSKNKVVLPFTVSNSSSVSFPCFSNASSSSLPNCTSTTPNVKLWHIRLGHLPFSSTNNVSFISIPSSSDCFCDICPKASTISHGRGKFEPRVKACVFLGYPLNQKGYKILELDSHKIVISRDVTFFEAIFPFTVTSSNSTSIFSTPSPDTQYSTVTDSSSDVSVPNIPSPNSFSSDSSPSPPNCPSLKTSLVTDSILPTGSIPLRRSHRSTKGTLPIHLQDYFCNNIFLSPVTKSYFAAPITSTGISPTGILPFNQLLLESVSQITEPNSYYQTSLHLSWSKAM
ncbi:uncharacterized protein LOC125847275 [Solanum stenotomum]|uniref:uncharacterized protein LOC125847275 n=1 Tax=Solanum stenotomum TaxID=172797 RepID=UPI0020D151E0|nr:uncharacterized protein LOC125847275 [Solanum stenotomum]